MKLSHSKVQKYSTCKRMYEFHYIKKIRNKYLGSPLFFGCALDDSINLMLLKKKKKDNLSKEESYLLEQFKGDHKELFLREMSTMVHNRSKLSLRDSLITEYNQADMDLSVLTEAVKAQLSKETGYSDLQEIVDFVYGEKRKGNDVLNEELKAYNKIGWECLVAKGNMILDTYEEEIIPLIEEVFTVQEKVTLKNEQGDEIEGYIDFTCKFVGDDNVYVCDNKSSSKPYKQNQLDESDQLHLYSDYKELDHIAYIVYEKNIRKRSPKVRINILKGSVNEDYFEKVFDKFEKARYGISERDFSPTKDKSTCKMQFGKPCIYYDICYHDKLGDKVIKVNQKEN